ncbi:MAG: hypothetical protein CFE44_06460, partial [Burkholderiales bacterium PBB4]
SKKSGSSGVIVVVLILIAAAAGYVVMKKLSPPAPKASPGTPTAAESMGLNVNKPPETKPKPKEVKPNDSGSTVERPKPPKPDDFEEKNPAVVETPPSRPDDPAFVEKPDPVPAPPVSTFDVQGFLTKAKDIMMAKAKPSVTKRDEGLVKNVDSLGKALKRVARRAEYGQDYMEEQIEKRLEAIREKGNRIPIEPHLDEIGRDKIGEQLRDAYKDHLASQTKIDELLSADLASLSRTYITGIELQIKRLKPSVDDVAIEALKTEISNTATDSSHFETLLLGPKEVEEDPDKDKNNPFR